MNMAVALRTNTPITIYNKYRLANADLYQRVQIDAVEWEQRHARSQFDSADLATIFILMSTATTGYLLPKAWQLLSSKVGYWTLQVDDVVVKGLIDTELTSAFTLSNLKNANDDVLVITYVDTNDFGSANMQHWEVGAK